MMKAASTRCAAARARPGAHAQRRVEVRQRLVEQEQLGLLDDRAADRDALALAARHLPRLLVELRLDLEHPRRLGDRGRSRPWARARS
jgi:hypothetical protein